nr:MAG TPA: hypothetical protein [Caudoviricetes sp.]
MPPCDMLFSRCIISYIVICFLKGDFHGAI